MRCETVKPKLLDCDRGLLSGSEASEVRDHLATCAECRAVLCDELAFLRRLAAIPAEEPANDVWALVRSQIRPRRFSTEAVRSLLARGTLVKRTVLVAAALGVFAVTIHTGLKPQDNGKTVIGSAQSAAYVGWSDDPLGEHSDALVKFMDDL